MSRMMSLQELTLEGWEASTDSREGAGLRFHGVGGEVVAVPHGQITAVTAVPDWGCVEVRLVGDRERPTLGLQCDDPERIRHAIMRLIHSETKQLLYSLQTSPVSRPPQDKQSIQPFKN